MKGVIKVARKYEIRSVEEKLSIVKRNLAGESATSLAKEIHSSDSLIREWAKKYLEGGEKALVNKRKPGNPLVRYERKKELTYDEQLEYKVALLERELLKKEAEVERLKQRNVRKGVDIPKK